MAALVWNEWLPEEQAALIRTEEPKRYGALVEHLEQLWSHDKAQHGVAAAADATLPFVPLAKALINARAEPEPAVLQRIPPQQEAAAHAVGSLLSLGQLPEAPTPAVPLYTEAILSRCFAIIRNLDSPEQSGGEHGGQAQKLGEEGSFLLNSHSMFRPLMELLFARLPSSLRTTATRRTAQFLLDSSLINAGPEASILCNAVAWADPQCAAPERLALLVEHLHNDLASVTAGARLSKARLLQELPALAELPGENVRQLAAQLAAFVPCSVLEAAGDSPAAAMSSGNGNGSSDSEMVLVDAPPPVGLEAGSGSSASLEAVPAVDDALLVVASGPVALRRAAMAYLDGVVDMFDRSTALMLTALRSGEAGGVQHMTPPAGSTGTATPGMQAGTGAATPAMDATALSAAAASASGGGLEGAEGEGAPEHMEASAALMSEDEAVLLCGPSEAEVEAGGHGQLVHIEGSPEFQKAVVQVSFCLEFMVQLLMGGEGLCLAPFLPRMLSSLLRLQDASPTQLQSVVFMSPPPPLPKPPSAPPQLLRPAPQLLAFANLTATSAGVTVVVPAGGSSSSSYSHAVLLCTPHRAAMAANVMQQLRLLPGLEQLRGAQFLLTGLAPQTQYTCTATAATAQGQQSVASAEQLTVQPS